MSPDLRLLLWTLVLTFVQVIVAVLAAGLGMLAGNRDTLPPLTGFAGRSRRAHLNMLESLPLFIGLVLIAQIVSKTNGATLTGCVLSSGVGSSIGSSTSSAYRGCGRSPGWWRADRDLRPAGMSANR